MEDLLVKHWDLVASFVMILILIIAYFLRQKMSKVDDIEKDYLAKFADLKKTNNDNHGQVIAAINELGMKIEVITGKVNTQAQICKLIQNQKRHRKDDD